MAGASHLDRLAVIGATQQWTWRQIHLASIALAKKFDETSTICNLCNTRVGFLVTWLAALRRGCLQLLPPSGGHADLTAILKACSGAMVIVDDEQLLHPQWKEHARCLINAPAEIQWSLSDEVALWTPDWNLPTVRLYTSGSTGTPEPQMRTLGQLARGAQVLGSRLNEEVDGGLITIKSIVCSVSPQHMFGLETSVMLSLVHAIPVLDRRPLLPADVNTALKQLAIGALWIATPLHLQALVTAGDEVINCNLVIASTMALNPVVAEHAERLAKAPVLEIYGSTETGVLAMRRTARDVSWQPVHGVHIDISESDAQVSGSHFPSPQRLTDHILPDKYGNFKLLGRHGDMIKIAGRRTSLAGLNSLLDDLPGLTDGVFYLPTTGAFADRLVLIHAGVTRLNAEATQRWLRERIDPVFLPRGIIQVLSLERTDSGKLSRATLDRIYAAWRSERKSDEPV